MNVLSLFDGMSCGQIALNRIGIKPSKYYAAEVDRYAITVTQANYPDTIQLGDVTAWREWDIDWSSIDLLIGGSHVKALVLQANNWRSMIRAVRCFLCTLIFSTIFVASTLKSNSCLKTSG